VLTGRQKQQHAYYGAAHRICHHSHSPLARAQLMMSHTHSDGGVQGERGDAGGLLAPLPGPADRWVLFHQSSVTSARITCCITHPTPPTLRPNPTQPPLNPTSTQPTLRPTHPLPNPPLPNPPFTQPTLHTTHPSHNPPPPTHPSPGKYIPGGPKPSGPRSSIYASKIAEVQPLIEVLRAVGKERGKSPAQVALNWTVCKGALPIPGAKSAKQVRCWGRVQCVPFLKRG